MNVACRSLECPFGTDESVVAHLQIFSAHDGALLKVLSAIPDLQVAWLLLFHCTNPTCQYAFRELPPASLQSAYLLRPQCPAHAPATNFVCWADGLPAVISCDRACVCPPPKPRFSPPPPWLAMSHGWCFYDVLMYFFGSHFLLMLAFCFRFYDACGYG